jgi:hypothetical protein
VRENADEDRSLALEVASDGDTAGFDLHSLDPGTLKRLETVFTETDLVARGRYAFAAATLDFTVFYSARKQGHGAISFLKKWGRGSVVL